MPASAQKSTAPSREYSSPATPRSPRNPLQHQRQRIHQRDRRSRTGRPSFAQAINLENDLAALHKTFLLIAGADDEAFTLDEYEPTISAQTSHIQYELFMGISHIGVITGQTAIDAVAEWTSQR